MKSGFETTKADNKTANQKKDVEKFFYWILCSMFAT